MRWFGPFAITKNDTARFNYWNGGNDDVRVQWRFSDALTGESLCDNFGKPTMVAAGKGAFWDINETINSDGHEVVNCEGSRRDRKSVV